MNDNVHTLRVEPKQTHHKYRHHDITVVYLPQDKVFEWRFTFNVRPIVFRGECPTSALALAEAKNELNKLLDAT